MRSASLKLWFSAFITKRMASPPSEHAPKQCHVPRSGSTMNDGVRSVWNGHRALNTRPDCDNGT